MRIDLLFARRQADYFGALSIVATVTGTVPSHALLTDAETQTVIETVKPVGQVFTINKLPNNLFYLTIYAPGFNPQTRLVRPV